MRTLNRVGALSAVAAAAVLCVPAAAHATGSGGDTYTVQLRQELPRTSTTDDGGAPQQGRGECPGVPEGQDGWHFVLPGNSTDFVKLTVSFEPGGQQVVTDFGPPSDKHAYVASQPGAELTSAVAEVRGGELELFNLSHTCPATDGGTPSATPGTPDPTNGGEETGPAEEPTQGESAEASETSEEAAPAVSSSPSTQGGGSEGDLAETGNGAPVGLLSAAAAALLAAGGYLAFRRRKA
ncbi:LPXTG cell wall anchor domain-containing protein [Streptomyces sp. AC550_RSS872]|uniref:LPXTG cell wall anchor domain-containing protein n=1 Tax=Streptomyces sp. AC550_RSS872 TaxID=2823689 RepID=UPI0020B79DFA|nr:LPXTG cell wall anchor domain-containing protein [Streptomyces sp. AC550_RSS872]